MPVAPTHARTPDSATHGAGNDYACLRCSVLGTDPDWVCWLCGRNDRTVLPSTARKLHGWPGWGVAQRRTFGPGEDT